MSIKTLGVIGISVTAGYFAYQYMKTIDQMKFNKESTHDKDFDYIKNDDDLPN